MIARLPGRDVDVEDRAAVLLAERGGVELGVGDDRLTDAPAEDLGDIVNAVSFRLAIGRSTTLDLVGRDGAPSGMSTAATTVGSVETGGC